MPTQGPSFDFEAALASKNAPALTRVPVCTAKLWGREGKHVPGWHAFGISPRHVTCHKVSVRSISSVKEVTTSFLREI